MNRFLLLLPLALLGTVPHAAGTPSRVGFVNVSKLVAALPGSSTYLNLRKTADADLAKQQASLQTLAAKAARSKTAADRNAFTKAQSAYASAQKSYQTKISNAFKPLATKVDAAIATVARANGYSVVLDQQVAAASKLVVYANPATTDLTAAALKALQK